MPCNWLKIGDTVAHIRTSRPRRRKCFYCDNWHEFLCDFPVYTRRGKKKDCDRPLCANCTQKGISPNVDFCKQHFPLAKAAYERRMNRQVNSNKK